MVSCSDPSRSSTLIGITPEPETITLSRLTVVNPVNAKVSTYSPGGSVTIRYCPVPSVTAERIFSVSAGLVASTLTPGNTAPDVSRTTPAMVACPNAAADVR